MPFENNNTSETIDNEKINAEGIEKYLDSFEGKSEKFIEDRENVLKALNYSEKSLRDKLGSTDIDLEFKDGKYYIISENGLNGIKGYTAEEFVAEYGKKEKSIFEKGEEIFESFFGGKETFKEDPYTIINEGDSDELIIAKNELIDLYNRDYLTREEFLKQEYELRNLIEKLSKKEYILSKKLEKLEKDLSKANNDLDSYLENNGYGEIQYLDEQEYGEDILGYLETIKNIKEEIQVITKKIKNKKEQN